MALDGILPAFALAFSMPLVRMDEVSGRTAFWRGSHRKAEATGDHDWAPTVEPGSAIVRDFRTKHGGLANTGEAPRPVIFTVLSREWWVEMRPRGDPVRAADDLASGARRARAAHAAPAASGQSGGLTSAT